MGLLNNSSLNLLLEQVILPPVLVFEEGQLLLLLILKSKLKIFLLFLMVFELDLEAGLLSKSTDQLRINMDTSDVTLLEGDTVFVELLVELGHHFGGHIRLKIEYLMQEDGVDEVSDVLLNFGGEELVESTSSEPVHEHMDKLLVVCWKFESEMDININVGIVFSWAFLDWGVIVDEALGHQADYSSVAAVAPMGTGLHQWE